MTHLTAGGGGGGFRTPPLKISETDRWNIKCVVLVDSYDPPESIGTKKIQNIPCMTSQWTHFHLHHVLRHAVIILSHSSPPHTTYPQTRCSAVCAACVVHDEHWFQKENKEKTKIYSNYTPMAGCTIRSYKIVQKLSPKHAARGVAQSPYPIYRHGKACLSMHYFSWTICTYYVKTVTRTTSTLTTTRLQNIPIANCKADIRYQRPYLEVQQCDHINWF